MLFYRVSHNLWQFTGNWLQIANYGRYSNFEAIFKMPCSFTFRQIQKKSHSAKNRVFKLLFFKVTKKTLGAGFPISCSRCQLNGVVSSLCWSLRESFFKRLAPVAFSLKHLHFFVGIMTKGRILHGCHILEDEGNALVAGGQSTGWVNINSVEVYDIDGASWSRLGNMPITSLSYFVLGSNWVTRDHNSPTTYAYDSVTDKWQRLANNIEFKSSGYLLFDAEDIPMICSLQD